jgi:hypothetical protein
MNRGDQDPHEQSRRSFLTRAVYVAPLVLSLRADLALASHGSSKPVKGNNGVGNGEDPQPPGNPRVNDGAGTGPGHPGQRRR